MERSAPLQEYGQPAPDHTADAESLAGLYAFGALDGAELARFEQHLAGCGRCAEVVDGDLAIVSMLSLTAPEAEPAPDLKERLLARATAEGGAGLTGSHVMAVQTGRASSLAWLLPWAAIVVALLVGSGLLSREISSAQSAQVVTVATLENRFDRGRAEVLVRRSGESVIQLSGFDDLGDGRVYQAWVIRPGSQPLPTGASTDGDGTLTLDGDVRGATVAVTLEPGPGARAPSTQPFLVGEVPA